MTRGDLMMDSAGQTPDDNRNRRARSAAAAAVEGLVTGPSGTVTYTSRGRVMVIGGEEAQWLAARIAEPLHAEVLLTDGDLEPGVPTTPQAGRRLVLSGHLGAFVAELGEPGRHNHQRLAADLVLDLGDKPLIAAEIPPPGYWHLGREPGDLDAGLLAVDGMVGTFEKPRFFAYDPGICAHARSGRSGCSRCIEACPAEAIVSIGERIEVDPNLCQGGGICASVCPTGAIRYAYPPAIDTAERVRRLLAAYLAAGGSAPRVLFVADADAADLPSAPANVLPVAVEELASIGHEIWLAALAWGAHGVALVDGGSVPVRSLTALRAQVETTAQLLRGMGHADAAVRLIGADAIGEGWPSVDGPPPAATFAALADKRQLAALALDHLWRHSATHPISCELSAAAPYGCIEVDTARCTLCMACTSVCPAKALGAGDEVPRLDLFEGNCVQCGICANACPEQAITLRARYLYDPEDRRRPRTLHEDRPFCCVRCGKPFATHAVIDRILGRLADHAMFQNERARQRLQMCEDCRVVDAVQDTEAMQAGLRFADEQKENGG